MTKLLAKHARDPDTFTMRYAIGMCIGNMVAGSDTTAIALSACLYYLLKGRHCFEQLRAEVDDLRRQGRMSRRISFKESQEMLYLQAVIKEALRLHPATRLPLERVVPEGGANMCGRFFPEGVSLMLSRSTIV